MARTEGRTAKALDLNRAATAEQWQYRQHAALAHELAGRLLLETGDQEAARAALPEARAAYERWGAWPRCGTWRPGTGSREGDAAEDRLIPRKD